MNGSEKLNRRLSNAAGLALALMLGACSSGDNEPEGRGDGNGISGLNLRAGLKSFARAEDFYEELRTELSRQADPYLAGSDGRDVAAESESSLSAPDSIGDSDQAADTREGGGVTELTGTNVQEVGVDEADRVKTTSDGRFLFVLDPGQPQFYDTDDIVLVDGFDRVEPSEPKLRVLQMDAAAPGAVALGDFDPGLSGQSVDGFYISDDDGTVTMLSSHFRFAGENYWDIGWGGYADTETWITNVSVTDPATPAVTVRKKVDGQLISSRRIGDALYLATRYSPYLEGYSYWNEPEAWQQALAEADMSTLMPSIGSVDGGDTTPMVSGEDCRVLDTANSNDSWTPAPDIITLAVLDLTTLTVRDSTCFLGQTETLYASQDAIYLATSYWDYGFVVDEAVSIGSPDIAVTDIENSTAEVIEGLSWEPPTVGTAIHRFALSAESIDYTGSGDIPGHLGWNALQRPFRFSDYEGVLRVASLANDWEARSASPVTLSLLRPDGDGNLQIVGQLPNADNPQPIGKPGERLYASRFIRDRGYLVTFRHTDPLYILGLDDPANPRMLGELEITGYSDYLHPIGETHLLGIGKDAVAIGDGGLQQGVKLSLFDVSNPAAPSEVQSVIVGQRGTESNALYDHRAVTVQPATDEHPTRVAISVDLAGVPAPDPALAQSQPSNFYGYTHSGLYGFEVSTGADAGITRNGAMVVRTASSGYPDYYRAGGDRSILADDGVFYIFGTEVYTAPWNNLGNVSGPQ